MAGALKEARVRAVLAGFVVLAGSCATASVDDDWTPLIGDDLSGWTVKFAGELVGVNYRDTFKVEDGVLRVDYSGWDKLDGTFGHIFTDVDYSAYDLRFEYRTVGEQVAGAPDWGFRNNGVLIHAQAPETMELGQGFPQSLEVQLLGADGDTYRSTGNMCSPGTDVVVADVRTDTHCIDSNKATTPHGEWVAVRVEAEAGGAVRWFVNDVETFAVDAVVVNPDDPVMPVGRGEDGDRLLSGRIAFQAESHPTEFRNVEIRVR